MIDQVAVDQFQASLQAEVLSPADAETRKTRIADVLYSHMTWIQGRHRHSDAGSPWRAAPRA
jgi:hypothetical protein